MQTTDAVLIVLILFAIIIVAILIAQPTPRHIKIAIDTLLGKLDIETENEPPPDASRRPHIKARDIEAERDALVRAQRPDRDLEIGNITAGRDATLFDEVVPPDSDPNPEPPA